MDTAEMPRTFVRPAPAPRRPAPTGRPRHRPPMALRVFTGLIGLCALLFNAALMMSDRAPRALRRIGGDLVVELSDRLDAESGITAAVEGAGSDTLVHVGVWAVAVLLAGVAVWSWPRLVLAAVFTFTLSVFIEAAQGVYTETRAVEIDDVVANGVGVLGGTAAVALLYVTWSSVATLFESARRA